MGKYFLYLIFLFATTLSAQNRNDVWMLGNGSSHGISFIGGVADTFSLSRPMDFFMSNASIGDSMGQLLFYTNGIYIANKRHDTLFNSAGFNPGWVTDYYGSYGSGESQGCLIIPRPNFNNQYYIFHESGEPIYQSTLGAAHPLNLSYSIVDMALDFGYGGIDAIRKNIHAIDDTLSWGRLSACKHANGRDYWILAHRYFSNVFYKLLVTPDTIIKYMQPIGLTNPFYNFYGQATFSPDGSKYCINLDDSSVGLFDFDRCTGMLSNSVAISHLDITPNGDSLALTGNAFSPNSRYLYISNNIHIWQYDTWAPNVLLSEQLVATWDTFYAPCCNVPTNFFELQLAPDNRIYVSQGIGNDIIHYIKYPDSSGVTCEVVQDSFYTAGFNSICFTNMVNYNLRNDSTSICDSILTISSTFFKQEYGISIFPNPAENHLWVDYKVRDNEDAVLEIYDLLGTLVHVHSLQGGKNSLLVSTEELTSGIYLYSLSSRNRRIFTGRIVIIK